MADEKEVEEQEEESQEENEEEESSEDESGEETDYKALYEAEKSKLEKSENDRKSAVGNQRSQRERDDQMNNISDDVAGLAKTVGFLVRATSSDNVEGLQENVEKVQQEQAVRVASRGFEVAYDALYNRLADDVRDEDGNTVIDLDKDPEFVKAWTTAHAAHDIATLTNLSAQKGSERLKVERENNRKLLADAKEAKKEGKSTVKKKKAGMDLGPSTGGAAGDTSGTDLFKKGLDKRPDLKVR